MHNGEVGRESKNLDFYMFYPENGEHILMQMK